MLLQASTLYKAYIKNCTTLARRASLFRYVVHGWSVQQARCKSVKFHLKKKWSEALEWSSPIKVTDERLLVLNFIEEYSVTWMLNFEDKKQRHEFHWKPDRNFSNRYQLGFGVFIHPTQPVGGCLFELQAEFKNHLCKIKSCRSALDVTRSVSMLQDYTWEELNPFDCCR